MIMSLHSVAGANMATVSGSLLLKSGVLRFVMEGERQGATGELRDFSPDAAQSPRVIGDAEAETDTDPLQASGKSGDQADRAKDAMILSLRNELKQQKGSTASSICVTITSPSFLPFLSPMNIIFSRILSC